MQMCAPLAWISLLLLSLAMPHAWADSEQPDHVPKHAENETSHTQDWFALPDFLANTADQFQWHGHISQGFAYSQKNNYLGNSKDGSFKFRELSFGGSWRPTSPLHISAQGLYRESGEVAPTGIELDFGIIDYRFIDTFSYAIGARAGRLKNPYGFYNETRDIATTRPGILLPQSIYIDYLREFIHSTDSVSLYSRKETNSGTWGFEILYGRIIVTSNTTQQLIGVDTRGDLKNDEAYVGRLSFQSASGLWRIAISHADLSTDFTPGAGELLTAGSTSARQWLFSSELLLDQWELVGEYQARTITSRGITDAFGIPMIKDDGYSFYVHLGFHLNDQWKMYLSRDTAYRNDDDKSGSQLPLTGRMQNDGFAKDTALGVRYRPTSKLTIGAEAHKISGTYWLPDEENSTLSDQSKDWNLYLIQVGYEF